jgi:hypothetical protein
MARLVALATLLVLCAVSLWWWAIGGRWYIVRTPSMGTYAPVGTLLWVKPASIRNIHVGDVITFHPPPIATGTGGRTNPAVSVLSQTYTHRVVARDPDDTLQTKGDLNGVRDPWHVDQRHLVGQVTERWPGVGWLIEAFPVLVPGVLLLWLLTSLFASKRSRAPWRVIGAALLVAGAIYVYNPLFGARQVSFVPLGRAGAKATYVGTGLMPVRLQAQGAHPVLVHAGQERSIVTAQPGQLGLFQVHVVPTIPWQTWAIIAMACFAPAVWSVIVGVEPPPVHRRRRKRPPGAASTAPELQPS